jgi:hypothetical protein
LNLRHPISSALRSLCLAACCTASAWASTYRGQVVFNGLPVPGATVTATQGTRKIVITSDASGMYSFADLPDGQWTITVDMLCFAPATQQITGSPTAEPVRFELKLLSVPQILAIASAPKAETPALPLTARTSAPTPAKPTETPKAAEAPKPASEAAESDGFLINGSSSNAATSKYALAPAFGNTRSSQSLYNAGIALRLDNSALDARPDSLTGLNTPKASYDRATIALNFGGPIRIPHLLPRGPNFFVGYQWTRDTNDTTLDGLVPDAAERMGDFTNEVNSLGQPITVYNPATGLPFAGDTVPVSGQAQALLALYPLPNLAGSTLYNFQVPVLSDTHDDSLQLRLNKGVGKREQFYGGYAFESSRSSAANLFGFVDKTDTLGMDANVNWTHRFRQRFFATTGFRFSRLRTLIDPFFANRENVSGAAGIGGNLQDPTDWGPPSLNFSSGTAGLTDAISTFNRSRTDALSESIYWNRSRHNFTFGGDFRRQETNILAQQNPRGSFTFTGAATAGTVNGVSTGGSDVADFLLGVPDTSSIAFGNADKYLRQSVYDAFFTDDWRLRPELTVNVGIRWEYGAPITELKNRLVNLDVAPGFTGAAPVLASAPTGSLTGTRYPTSLIRPDKHGFEPRLGLSWRPIPGSTLVVKAGYGIYDDTSIYSSSARNMAQQSPLSYSESVSNALTCPLTLANGFIQCAGTTADTFAVDPNLRVGYAQTWQLSAQKDLPFALVGTVTYFGSKGTRGIQEFLPNTYPIGSPVAASVPIGFVFKTSNGDSTRESGQVQLRRRLRAGLTASLQYTWSKSIDDDSVLGGSGPVGSGLSSSSTPASASIAQNWLDLQAERGLSTFDQRNLLNASLQYTSGMGVGGGTLLSGWRARLLKEWTVTSTINAGSGLPESPIFLAAVPGTGFTGTIRPNLTGAPLYLASNEVHLNAAAYAAPPSGQWGDARRDSIEGPSQFSMNASLARTFRLKDRYNLDLRVDSTNILNHVTFTSWNNTVNSTTFGLPAAANPMRSMQITTRLRY